MSVPLPRSAGPEDDARRLGWALFPVRLLPWFHLVYGGIQKLSDPGFLHAGAPTYIGTQLRGFAHGTPGGFVLRAFAIPHPALAGVGVASTEIAVGLLVATGLLTRAAATVGLLLNLLLFLTNSWRTYPYFLAQTSCLSSRGCRSSSPARRGNRRLNRSRGGSRCPALRRNGASPALPRQLCLRALRRPESQGSPVAAR